MAEHAADSQTPVADGSTHELDKGVRFASDAVALTQAPTRVGVLDWVLLLAAPIVVLLRMWASPYDYEDITIPFAVAHLTALLPFATLRVARRLARPAERLGRLTIGTLGVLFDGVRLAPSRGVALREVVVGDDAPVAVLATRAGKIKLRLRDAEEVRRLSDSLAVEQERARVLRLPSRLLTDPAQFARFGLYAVLVTVAFPIIGLTWHIDHVAALALLGLAVCTVVAILVAFMADTKVELSEGGIRLQWLRGARFVPFADLASADLHQEVADIAGSRRRRVLLLVTKAGEVLRLPCDEADAEAIAEVLRHARRGLAGGPVLPTEKAVQSLGRTPRDWVRALRALAGGARATHRTAPVAEAALYRVLDDDGAPADARAGAAVALVAALGEDAKTRVRIAALSASPRLRVALEAAAVAETDEEIEAALTELGAHAAVEPPVGAEAPALARF